MTLSRRQFLLSAAALSAAPAIVRAESLMKLWVPPPIVFEMNQIEVVTGMELVEHPNDYIVIGYENVNADYMLVERIYKREIERNLRQKVF